MTKRRKAFTRRRKLTASEITIHDARELRETKVRNDWLADHPGKTMADAEVAGSCRDTAEGEAEYHKWWDRRYAGLDPLNTPGGTA